MEIKFSIPVLCGILEEGGNLTKHATPCLASSSKIFNIGLVGHEILARNISSNFSLLIGDNTIKRVAIFNGSHNITASHCHIKHLCINIFNITSNSLDCLTLLVSEYDFNLAFYFFWLVNRLLFSHCA